MIFHQKSDQEHGKYRLVSNIPVVLFPFLSLLVLILVQNFLAIVDACQFWKYM
jgi:hypothetical protein